MKPVLIFDLDGTLADSLPGIAASLNRTLTAHGLPGHSDAAVRSFVGDGIRMLILRAAPQGADSALIDSLVTLYRNDYEASWDSGTTAYPGIHEMLEGFSSRGFRMSVLSNKAHDFTLAMVRGMFTQIPFTTILGQRDGIPHKPHPDGAIQIASEMKTAPEDCVLIGDSSVDMLTATNAGMQSIAVTWGYHDLECLKKTQTTYFATHPSELAGLVESIHFPIRA